MTATTPSLVNVDSFRPMDANFSVIIATTSCRSWDNEQEAWVTNGCEVSELKYTMCALGSLGILVSPLTLILCVSYL